jgi:pterin-4a-carbinolamine dehydratase
MTKEQLQGIRLKLEQGFMLERSEGWALLDEVTALQAEVRKQVFGSRVVFDREVVERAERAGEEHE